MSFISNKIEAFINEEDGIALTEYLILLGLIAAGVTATIATFGEELNNAWAQWNGFLTQLPEPTT